MRLKIFAFVALFTLQSINCLVEAEDLVVGFSKSEREIEHSVATSQSAFYRVARAATTEALTQVLSSKAGAHSPEFKLVLSDSLKVSSDYTRWSFRLRPGVTFHSSRKVTINDVVESLSQCQKRTVLEGIRSITSDMDSGRYGEIFWVNIILEKNQRELDQIRNFPAELSNCPIYPASVAERFGPDWGRGTSLIGSGPYQITDFQKDTSLTLSRFRAHRRRGSAPDTVVLRELSASDQGLAALRVGTIAVFFTEDSQVLNQAKTDETLIVDRCSKSNVIIRRNVHFRCDNELDIFELRYVS